jgi:hypothetical protein
MIEGVIG